MIAASKGYDTLVTLLLQHDADMGPRDQVTCLPSLTRRHGLCSDDCLAGWHSARECPEAWSHCSGADSGGFSGGVYDLHFVCLPIVYVRSAFIFVLVNRAYI